LKKVQRLKDFELFREHEKRHEVKRKREKMKCTSPETALLFHLAALIIFVSP
jgi:hypothetical protein